MTGPLTRVSACLLAAATGVGLAPCGAEAPRVFHYAADRKVPPSLEPVLRHLAAGQDDFPDEKDAEEVAARLAAWSALLRQDPRRARETAALLLAADFRGARLAPLEEAAVAARPDLDVQRGTRFAEASDRDARAFADDLQALVEGMDEVRVAEFLVTAIDVDRGAPARARSEVRYDLVGSGPGAWRLQRLGRWRIDWRREADGTWRAVAWTTLAATRSRATRPVFTETSATAFAGEPAYRRQLAYGLDQWLGRLDAVFMPGGMGHHGVSVGDADGDGMDDLYVSQPAGLPNRLFRNRGDGTFADVTEAAGLGVLDSTSQSLFADVDNDADQDLVLVTRSGLLLFANDGAGRYALRSDAFRFAGPLRGSPTSAAMADYDRDGFLDLYLCTYAYFIGQSEDKAGTPTPYHDARNGPPNVLLRNDGRGGFVDVTAEAGLAANNHRFSFAAAWADYDQDGWIDLLVANDFGAKNLYRNLGPRDGMVRFEDVAGKAGLEDYGAGMSAAFLDYDGDGRLDVYTGNMWTAAGRRVTGARGFMPEAAAELRALYGRHARGNGLFRNRGDGTFEDATLAAGAEMGRWAWSSDALDFDNDGDLDLYVVNGMFTRGPDQPELDLDSFFWRQVVARSPLELRRGTPFDDAWRATNRLLAGSGAQARHERNVFLRNDGRGGFDDVSGTVGLDLDQDGRSFAVLDHDGDGDADVAVMAARDGPQLRLFRNDQAAGHASLALRLSGTRSNRDAVGARVTVQTDVLRRTRVATAGSGFISQHSKELLFGLGASRRVVKVEIEWPSGLRQSVDGPPLGHRVFVEEGRDGVRSEPFRQALAAPSPTRTHDEGDLTPSTGTWLFRPVPAPDFVVRDLRGRERSLAGLRGRPAVLLFWSVAAPPASAALRDLSGAHAALAGAGASALALAVGQGEEAAGRVTEAAAGAQVPVALAGAETAGVYSILSRYLFDRREDLRLPTLLVVDAGGMVVKVHRDRIDVPEVLADLAKIEATPAERLARAVPFPGTFVTPPGERNDFQYGLELAEQGHEPASLAVFERVARLEPSAIAHFNLGTLLMKAGRSAEARAAFERALRLEAGHAEASNSLGALLAQGGDLKGAVARFQAALVTRPDFADALNNLGYALFQAERDEEALALYRKALAVQPDFPEAHNNLGIYHGQRGEMEEAEACFRRAVEARPAYGEATNNLALVLAARGDGPGAVVLLQRFLEREPAFEPSYLTLAKIYLSGGRNREGVQVLELLLQRNPRNAMALDLLRQLKPAAR